MKEITTDELKTRLVDGAPVAVVDIREPDEFSDWHIHGSSNVPVFAAIGQGDRSVVTEMLKTLPKDKPVVAVCRSGATSKVAAEILESMGYDAASLAGGIRGWSCAWTEARVPIGGGTTLIQIRRNGKGCLSYVLGSNGEAAVVDPCVDASVYTSIAEREGLRITHVFETHVHADHISRARALGGATGAALCIHKNDRVHFDYTALTDGRTIRIGECEVTVIHTPGHTMESACYRVGNEALLTGDTLFVESIGRPDLEKGDAGAEAGAAALYASLHGKLLSLDENLVVCPAHTSALIGFDGQPVAARLGEIVPSLELLKADEASFASDIIGLLGRKPPNFERVISINEGRAELGWLDPLDLEAGPNRCAVGRP